MSGDPANGNADKSVAALPGSDSDESDEEEEFQSQLSHFVKQISNRPSFIPKVNLRAWTTTHRRSHSFLVHESTSFILIGPFRKKGLN